MQFWPHDYQKKAIKFIEEHPIACLLLDMGLGKTIITLTALQNLMTDYFEVKRVLIIGPLRVARDTWPAEIKKWEHLQGLKYSVAVGTEVERLTALNDRESQIVIINRENIQWLIEKSGYRWNFDMVVIDELSSFKNHNVKRFKALMKVRPYIKRIVGLTGTPSSNGLMDLFAEYKLLDMGKRLGRFISQYREQYFLPDKRSQQMIFSYKLRQGADDEIYEKISDITISMRSGDYLKLPELVECSTAVEMDDKEKKIYNAMKKELATEIGEHQIDAVSAAALSNKLLQMANGAVYDDQKGVIKVHERKLEALEDLIESANGRPVLIAYWFKHDIQQIRSRLYAREIKSSKDIQEWNEGKIPVALIHPASAGHGLNLQAGGSFLIWYGLTWSLELYQQTNARLYRQGQKETVVIQHIITNGTIDERVMKALQKKGEVQDSLIEAVKAEVRNHEDS